MHSIFLINIDIYNYLEFLSWSSWLFLKVCMCFLLRQKERDYFRGKLSL